MKRVILSDVLEVVTGRMTLDSDAGAALKGMIELHAGIGRALASSPHEAVPGSY